MTKTITYNAGSTYASKDEEGTLSIEYTDDENVTLMGQVFSSSGYEVKEWNTSEDGTGTTYQLFEEYEGTVDLTLYAVWQLTNAGQVYIKNGDQVLDISNLILGMTTYYGKNQPFPYTVITLTKQLRDSEYWAERRTKDLSSSIYDDYTFPPELSQMSTIFSTDLFSVKCNWYYERIEDNDDQTYSITCVDRTYLMKYTTLENLFDFTYDNGSYTFSYIKDLMQIKTTESSTVDKIQFQGRYFAGAINLYIDHSNTPYISKIDGYGSIIFKIIAHTIGGYPYEDGFIIDDGYMPELTNYEIKDSYTSEEILALKNGNHVELKGDDKTYYADRVTLRPDEFCWDVIKSLGLLSNRTAFFYDKAYFVDYESTPIKYQDVGNIWIDWEGDDTQFEKDGVTYTKLMINNLSANNDQGSKYVRSSQKVISEGYEATITISDAKTTSSGNDIKFMYAEDVTKSGSDYVFSTETRNFQTRLVALNTLIRYYEPGDAIQFDIAETYHANRTLNTLPDDTEYEGEVIAINDESTLTTIYYKSSYISSDEVKWTRISDRDIAFQRDSKFGGYTRSDIMYDAQNDITLKNVPLAQTVIYYPSMITEYTWGEPEFMDEEGSLSTIEDITQDTVLDNTGDTSISNNYTAKIVVGNQKLSELDDDRTGFSGLILEKNWDADLYRLSGYNNGSLQTYINSQGEILSGDQTSANRVVINRDGITIGGVTPTPGEEGAGLELWDSTREYKVGEAVSYRTNTSEGYMVYVAMKDNVGQTPTKVDNTYWQYQGSTSQLYGTINASNNTVRGGGGSVIINSDGLKTYSGTTLQCSVGTNGVLEAGGGAVELSSSGMVTKKGTTTVTSIGTDGSFKTGYSGGTPYISLDNSGLKLRNVDDAVRYAQSAIHIIGADGSTEWGELSGHSYDGPDPDTIYPPVKYPTIQLASENGVRTYLSSYSGTAGDKANYSEICISPTTAPWVQWNGYDDSPHTYQLPSLTVKLDRAGAIMQGLGHIFNVQRANNSVPKYLICGLWTHSGVAGVGKQISFSPPFPNGVLYAACSTIRDDSTSRGNDYVYDVTNTGMKLKYESTKVGVFWLAIGY